MGNRLLIIGAFVGLLLIACAFWMWRENNRLNTELTKARASIAILQKARDADAAALNFHGITTHEVQHYANAKRKTLEDLAKDSGNDTDADFLRALRGVLYKSDAAASADTAAVAP